jgi:hypothetical protein
VNDEESTPSSAWSPPGSPPAAAPSGVPPPPPPPSGWDAPQATWSTAGYGAPPKTNALAIVSLVAGIAQFICFYFVGAIAAIVTGHIARGQIKRSQGRESGGGLALAGLILGYVGLALTVLAGLGIGLFFAFFADDVEETALRANARDYLEQAQELALANDRDVRDPDVLRRAFVDEADSDDEIELADGTPIPVADVTDWEANRWRIQLNGDFGAHVCAIVPIDAFSRPEVHDGECEDLRGGAATLRHLRPRSGAPA